MLFTEFNMEDALDVRYGEGRRDLLVSLVKDGDLSIEKAAEKLNITVKEFQELMK